MNLTLVLTHDCNLRCTYCYAGRKFGRAMPWDVARRAIDLALADPAPWTDLAFFGGEPLLALPLVRQSLDHARAEAASRRTTIRAQITTNGTLLTDEAVRFLGAERFHVGISLDGARKAHDATRPLRGGRSSFDAALAGLDRALAARLRVEVIAVVDPANVRWLGESVAFLADRGASKITLNPNFQADWTDESRAELERGYEAVAADYADRQRRASPIHVNFIDGKIITRLKKGFACGDRCGFGVREIAVAPSGNIYPCERLVGEDTDESLRMGNVFDGIDRAKQERYRRESGNRDPECDGCAIRPRCMNWCGCTNHSLTGSIDRTGDVICWHEKTAIRVADRTAATLFREARPAFMKRHYGVDGTGRGAPEATGETRGGGAVDAASACDIPRAALGRTSGDSGDGHVSPGFPAPRPEAEVTPCP